MAESKITYPNKFAGNSVTAEDLNEIKQVINAHADTIDSFKIGQDEDLRFPAATVKPGVANPPDWVLVDASNYGQLYVLEYDASTEEEVYIFAQLPHGWEEGTSLEPHIHWINHKDGVGDVVWALEYSIANIDGYFPKTPTTITATDTAAALASSEVKHQLTYLPDIDMSNMTASCMIMMRLYRKAGDAADTCNQPVGLLEFDIHYKNEKFGKDV